MAKGCGKARPEVLSGEERGRFGGEVPSLLFQEARTQREGGAGGRHIFFLCAPGLLPRTGHRQEAGSRLICRVLSPERGVTTDDTDK